MVCGTDEKGIIFTLIGFDTYAYGKDDLNRKEVRMEMGIFLEQE